MTNNKHDLRMTNGLRMRKVTVALFEILHFVRAN